MTYREVPCSHCGGRGTEPEPDATTEPQKRPSWWKRLLRRVGIGRDQWTEAELHLGLQDLQVRMTHRQLPDGRKLLLIDVTDLDDPQHLNRLLKMADAFSQMEDGIIRDRVIRMGRTWGKSQTAGEMMSRGVVTEVNGLFDRLRLRDDWQAEVPTENTQPVEKPEAGDRVDIWMDGHQVGQNLLVTDVEDVEKGNPEGYCVAFKADEHSEVKKGTAGGDMIAEEARQWSAAEHPALGRFQWRNARRHR